MCGRTTSRFGEGVAALIVNCFQDPDVVELVRRQWRSAAPALAIGDPYGDMLYLVQEPTRTYRYLASPFESAIAMTPSPPQGPRDDERLNHLVERLLDEVRGDRDLLVRIRVPGYFFDGRSFALLEPFLRAGFTVDVPIWERLVDLRMTPEALLDDCTTMVRRKIRKGLQAGPAWRVHYGEAVAEKVLGDLYEAAHHTRAAAGGRLKHPADIYLVHRRRAIEQGKAVLAVLEHEGFTGYLLVLVSKEIAFYFDGAWRGVRSDFANHLLHYNMMLFLRELGCRRYSVGYVFPDLVNPSETVSGMARFKHGLGANLSPIFMLTLTRTSRIGTFVAKLRANSLGRLVGRLRSGRR
jgi:hypothetical protein